MGSGSSVFRKLWGKKEVSPEGTSFLKYSIFFFSFIGDKILGKNRSTLLYLYALSALN